MQENVESTSESVVDTVGDLPYWDINMEASRTVRELLHLLDKNVHIPGVLVFEKGKLVGLIPREKVYEKLGRPFGVELYLKNTINQFYRLLGINTLVLDSESRINNAVQMALKREEQTLYEPIVIAHPKGYRVISMYSLLMAQQDKLQDLYTEVHYLSIKDPLSLINNRRGFFDAVNQKLVTIRDFDLEYAVMMIDIDSFKSVNDRYGHMVGDEVLKGVAQRIDNQLRENDISGRFGGDEFVVFIMGISKESAFNLAENIRQDIASVFHIIDGFQIRVSISIGISHSRGANNTLDRLLSEADQAVYVSKKMGRNKVTMWTDELSQSSLEPRNRRTVRSKTTVQEEQIQEQTLQGWLHMLYLRDYETEAHTKRVSELAMSLAKSAGVPEEEYEGIRVGALLHDIGKIGIPDNILFKKGKFTNAEWLIMQKHPQYAYDLISPISYFQHALVIPYCHHEHWDGSGYPRGLREQEIPLAARIFTIVDVWDALTSDRPYRAAWKEEAVIDYLSKQSGVLLDPALVSVFLGSQMKDPARN